MSFARSTFAAFSLGLALVGFSGCGSETQEAPVTTVPAKGKVTYKGKPLSSGTVVFEPEGAGREAQAEIKEDGTFELSTYKAGDGVVLGPHRVSVRGGSVQKARLPLKFANAASAKIEVEVTKDKSDYAIDLN